MRGGEIGAEEGGGRLETSSASRKEIASALGAENSKGRKRSKGRQEGRKHNNGRGKRENTE